MRHYHCHVINYSLSSKLRINWMTLLLSVRSKDDIKLTAVSPSHLNRFLPHDAALARAYMPGPTMCVCVLRWEGNRRSHNRCS